jgi:hypothetical protein
MLFGIALVLLGPMLIAVERRTLRRIGRRPRPDELQPKLKMFERLRSFRRLKIGYLIALLGAIVIVGDVLEPRERPIVYITAWIFAALICVALVRLAMQDYIASRRHWDAELVRTENEAARAQADYRKLQGPNGDRPT